MDRPIDISGSHKGTVKMIPQVCRLISVQYAADNFDWTACVDSIRLLHTLDHIYQNINLVFLPVDFHNPKISAYYSLS